MESPSETSPVSIPDEWPGSFGLYKYSRQAMQLNVWPYVSIYVLTFIINIALARVSYDLRFLSYLISVVTDTFSTILLLASVRGEKVSFGDTLGKSFPYFFKMLVLLIVMSVSLIISFVLLIVPFFFVLPRVILAPYFLIDKNLGPLEAFSASWDATKGHATKVWGVIGVTILMALLMITIVGIPFSIYFLIMYAAANALLYKFIIASAGPQTPKASKAPVASPAN